ncbi:hypothetical protein BGP_6266 [Beggiatoa sp. PS]|nr:hypothetical protein BGP_6266 [Beggiatoa sp. PS]
MPVEMHHTLLFYALNQFHQRYQLEGLLLLE